MRVCEPNRLLKSTFKLTLVQRAVLLARLQVSAKLERAAAVVLRRLADKPVCLNCCGTRAVRNAQADDFQRSKCRECSATFNARTGTVLARLGHRGRWLDQCDALPHGLSVRKAVARIGVHRTTAFRSRLRFLQCPAKKKDSALRGIVEAGETYMLQSFKGQRQALALAGQPSRRRGGKTRKRELSHEQISILVLRNRTDQSADFVLPVAADYEQAKAVLSGAVAVDAVLCTDGSGLLASVDDALSIEHQPLNISKGQRVRGTWHVQNLNAYQGCFKRWLRGFSGVASSYLPNYFGWFRALDRHTRPSTQRPHGCSLSLPAPDVNIT